MFGIGIQAHQVIAKQNGRTVWASSPMRDYAQAVMLKRSQETHDRGHGHAVTDGTVYSIFSADADFFA